MPSTLFTVLPNSMEIAFDVARKINGVPDDVTDEDALAQAKIDPNTIALILQIIQEVMGCLNNSRAVGFKRVRDHFGLKPLEKIADQMRLNSIINRWSNAMAVGRKQGDVVLIREALASIAAGIDENKFGAIQAEMLFLTV